MSRSQPPPSSRTLLLVVGVGRSGTSLLTGILGQFGLHIPQPEINADSTNPRGFGEPRWVVDFHTRLLRERRVTVNDARPAAWQVTGELTQSDELRGWLGTQLESGPVVAVKDPRTVWFLPLWQRAAAELGADTAFVTMLRHPAEIVRSARTSYGTWQGEASRAAACLNVMLETERATRNAPRSFVRHEDLLADWHREIRRVGATLRLPALQEAERLAAVDQFVDPGLHRSRARWDELDVPNRLRDLADEVWTQVQRLPVADGPELHAILDTLRAAYQQLYDESEKIAQSSITAALPRGARAPAGRGGRLLRLLPPGMRQRLRSRLRRLRGRG
ncbi:MAG TPA: sulfotransferase [Candidatus Limnocylindria bacterium]|nr:sulfotransferase [Candidatus Limnocylindria bacterium]